MTSVTVQLTSRLIAASWSVIRSSWAPSGGFALALRQSEAACWQESDNGLYITTLGAAQYRNNRYTAALKTLTASEKRTAALYKRSPPVDLAFLAMTKFQVGKKVESTATLRRLRDTMKTWPFDRDAEDLFHEAERLIEPSK
jgi:hypothetical protein